MFKIPSMIYVVDIVMENGVGIQISNLDDVLLHFNSR